MVLLGQGAFSSSAVLIMFHFTEPIRSDRTLWASPSWSWEHFWLLVLSQYILLCLTQSRCLIVLLLLLLLKASPLTEMSFLFFIIKTHSHSFLGLSWVRLLDAESEMGIVLHTVYWEDAISKDKPLRKWGQQDKAGMKTKGSFQLKSCLSLTPQGALELEGHPSGGGQAFSTLS